MLKESEATGWWNRKRKSSKERCNRIQASDSQDRNIPYALVLSSSNESREAQAPPLIQVRPRPLCSLHFNDRHWLAVHICLNSRRQVTRLYRSGGCISITHAGLAWNSVPVDFFWEKTQVLGVESTSDKANRAKAIFLFRRPRSAQERPEAPLARALSSFSSNNHYVHRVSEAIKIVSLQFNPILYMGENGVNVTLVRWPQL